MTLHPKKSLVGLPRLCMLELGSAAKNVWFIHVLLFRKTGRSFEGKMGRTVDV
jgi:hypothetical protein